MVRRSHAASDFDGLSEVPTDLNWAQLDRAVGTHNTDLQALSTKQ